MASDRRHRTRSAPRGRKVGVHSLRETGQAVLVMVILLTIMIVAAAGLLATNVIEHDPLVQTDVVQHYSYRAAEAGLNAYLAQVNGNSNLINCTNTSPAGGQCNPSDYDTWTQVDQTTGNGIVPEWYLWEDPTFCFNPACNVAPTPTSTLDHVQVVIYGAAGFPGHIVYQHTVANLAPASGFLTRVWWSQYEATDPALRPGLQDDCTYDYDNTPAYSGASHSGACSPVEFANGDQVYGPLFSDDSFYVGGDPTLGPVTTADPHCLFVTDWANPPANGYCTAAPNNGVVQQSPSDAANSAKAQAPQLAPTTDNALAAYAKLDGCLYQGPTTITFDAAGRMSVWSPNTTTEANSNTCLGLNVPVPNGANGNGVIYVQTATPVAPAVCVAGANPYDDWTGTANGAQAQVALDGGPANYFGAQANNDCEGDAFVSDNPGGTNADSPPLPNKTAGGIQGQLTVASQNNIVITGNLQYTDCGGSFDSTVLHPCQYNVGGQNDVLGLIAQNYVEVNHPVVPNCSTVHGRTTCSPITYSGGNGRATQSSEPACTTGQLGIPSVALCDPGTNGLTIDAAVLALAHSFTVNNEGLYDQGSGASYGVGTPENGDLVVYGSIAQIWRGAVGIAGPESGYVKDYDWDNRAQYVSPPYYLTPGTPIWDLTSSATLLDTAVPATPVGAAP